MLKKISFGFSATLVSSLLVPALVLAVSCSPPSLIPPNNTCDISEAVTVTATVPASGVTFSGFAPPASVVTIKENDLVVGTAVTNSNGEFSKTVTSNPGVHNFTIYATDNAGLSTPEISISNISVIAHTNTPVTSIPLPPTITVSADAVTNGQAVSLSGQGPPGSYINLFLNSTKIYTSLISASGTWSYSTSSDYKLGTNSAYATLTRLSVEESTPSKVVTFQVVECDLSDPACAPPTQTPKEAEGRKGFDINFGFGVELSRRLTFILLTTIFTSSLVVVLLLFFFWKRRRKKKTEVLEELKVKVEKDVDQDKPKERIEKDFSEAEKEIE